jgi:low affinity Fe/Cu permease
MKNSLRSISTKISILAGTTWAFTVAVLVVLIWIITGPHYHFSNTWLIVVTTVTDIIVFLMVFSLQASQNRDSKAIQMKLNELIVADKQASNEFVGLETLTDEELSDLDEEFKEMLTMATKPALHKLHTKIREEKSIRSSKQKPGDH